MIDCWFIKQIWDLFKVIYGGIIWVIFKVNEKDLDLNEEEEEVNMILMEKIDFDNEEEFFEVNVKIVV